MMKRDEGEDDFVTKTAKHRKKHAANGAQQSDDPAKASSSNDGKPPTGAPTGAASTGSAGATAAAPAAGDGGGISLRPRTMFAMKGRGRTESEGSAYRPQWSKDGEGFVTAASSNGSAGVAKDSASAAHHDPQGVADASRRKGKVLRYSKEELLALHFTTTSPPEFPPETMVASDLALPPVSTLPFDYEEIYEQWKLNRNRGRGRGRGTTTTGQSGTDGQQQQQSDRSRSNGKWEDEKWDKSAKRDNENQQQGEEGTWQRGLKPSSSSRQRDDIWDDVGGDSNEMDLSSMAVAAERFRREMDAMRDELNAPVAVDLKEHNGDLDEFDKKLEVAAAAGQFDDSDEEDVQWDEPTDIGGLGGSGNSAAGSLGDHGSSFFNQSSPTVESQFGILDTKQFSLGSEEKSFSLQQLGGEPLPTLEPLRMVMEVRDEWFYLDPQGIQQGPFKSAEMREWFEAGYFKPHLPIRFGQEGQFTPLASQFLHGQVPFATPPPQPSPKIAAENERQRLFALQQEQQRQEQLQQQQMLQLQQQQEHQRMLQLNQEEKIRMEMQRLEIARQQQSHLYQQQLQHQQQQQLQQQQQQHQQQQQQQHMLLQQQSSWQRTQREGIMSALGIFGGNDQDRNATDSFHTGMQPQFQSDFRTQHHHQFGSHDPAMRDSLFLNDGGARQQNEFWQSSVNAPVLGGEPLFNQAQPSSSTNSSSVDALLQSQAAAQEKADAPLDPWGKPKTSELSSSFSSLHEIQNEEKRKAADEVRNALSNSPDKPAAPAPAAASPPRPAAPAAKQPGSTQKQTAAPAAKAETTTSSNTKKTAAPKQKGKPADNNKNGKSGGAWVDPSAAPRKSLQEIQQEEQRELRKKMEETSSVTNLEQMGAQLKMMLGVASLAGPAASSSASSAPASSAPQPPAPSSSSSGASPWGVPAAAAQPTQASKKQSLRDILAEEERLAQERAKQSQGAAPASSHWVNVVAGTSLGAAPAPKPSRSLGPVPVSVLKSRQQIRAPNGSEAVGAAGAVKTASPTPPKADDASFWNFGAAQAAKSSTSTSSSNERPADVKVSNAFGSTGVSSEFMSWAAKQFQLISGRNDLTLMEYCASLEDPGEIREYLAAYLGSTPRVSAFATEFIQRKKKGPSDILKRSPSASSSSGGKQQQDEAADAAAGGAKKGSKRRGGKGQKIDPSLLNFA